MLLDQDRWSLQIFEERVPADSQQLLYEVWNQRSIQALADSEVQVKQSASVPWRRRRLDADRQGGGQHPCG